MASQLPPKPRKRWLSWLVGKQTPPVPLPEERQNYPTINWNPLRWAFFWWLNPILKVGYQRTLQPEDLYVLNDSQKVNTMYETFSKTLGDGTVTQRHLYYALYKTLGREYGVAVLFKLLSDLASTLSPLIQKELILFVERRVAGEEVSIGKGVGYAIGCAAMILFIGLTLNQFMYGSMLTGAKLKVILTRHVIEKGFRLDEAGRALYPSGKLNSLMSTDLGRMDQAMRFIPYVLVFPVPLVVSLVLLITRLGVAALLGFAIYLIGGGLIVGTFTTIIKYRRRANFYTDQRVSLMKDLLNNYRIFKLYSWEKLFSEKLVDVRTHEMDNVLRLEQIRTQITSLNVNLSTVGSMATFCLLYTLNPYKSVGDIFSSLSLFQVLGQMFTLIPVGVALLLEFHVATKRVCDLYSCNDEVVSVPGRLPDGKLALELKDAAFAWQDTSTFAGFTDLNMDISKGEFIVIVGEIGAGKTSLLRAIAGFMPKTAGSIDIQGSLLLLDGSWICNGTIRDNVTFGLSYDHKRYSDVVEACSLVQDINELDGGDLTEVGERGVTLSGGQKARIALARSVYAGTDIIVLDDVLSALDAKVSNQIVENCIMGLLAQKTRIMATHQLSIVDKADRIIFLAKGEPPVMGSKAELMKNPRFKDLHSYAYKHEVGKSLVVKDTYTETTIGSKIISEEDRAEKRVKAAVVKRYFKLGEGRLGAGDFVVFVSVVIISTFCYLFTSVWLAYWNEMKFDRSPTFYMGMYGLFTGLSVILICAQFLELANFCNRASKRLNLQATVRLLYAPVSYVETSLLGRILNRFTKDTDVLDNEMTNQARVFIKLSSQIIGIIILCICYLPWFAIAIPPLALLYFAIEFFYESSAIEVKRLESVQRSKVYAQFNEMLTGMDTLKEYGAVKRWIKMLDDKQDTMNEAYFITLANQSWLGTNLDIIATVMALVVCLLCCFGVFGIGAADTGVVVTYILSIANMLSGAVRFFTQLQNNMNSVERLSYYASDLEQEAAYEIPGAVSHTWPEKGGIKFENVRMRYRPELPEVLKGINFEVHPGKRVGICGRTGAGKSSLTMCLYRIIERSAGKVFIDGVDTAKIGLHTLRSKISIIPQDPAMFKGTVRSNLDPFDKVDDGTLEKALFKSGATKNLTLDTVVEDNGGNLSMGERQLVTIARALVSDNKILVLDEATANIDYKTDTEVQAKMADIHCTVLCIAHRLRTILDYDRIVVMDKGKVAGFDTPVTLYEHNETFRSMCTAAGITREDFN